MRDGVLENIPRFGESLAGIRHSFSGLSTQLNEDKATALTAAAESDANRAAFEKIAANLHAMFERISAAGQSVDGLSRRMQGTIASSSRLANAELANIEELTLKLEVYKVLLGLSGLKPEELPDETQCRLGRWYYDSEKTGSCMAIGGWI